jgi:hypothetical protein
MAKGADKFSARIDNAKKMVGKLGSGVMAVGKYAAVAGGAAVAAGVGIFTLAKSSSEAADNIQHTASTLGLSTEALQEYRYAGIAAGLTTEEMDAALSKLTVNLGKDSEAISNALYQIGLTSEQLKAAGPDKTLEMIASGFQNVKDPAKKAAVATALFGKSSIRMVEALSNGPEAIESLRKEAQEVGYVMGGDTLANAGKLNETLDRFSATATGLGNRLASKVMPQVTKFVESLSRGIQPGGMFSKMLDSVGNFLGKGGDFIGPILDRIIEFIPKITGFVSGLIDALQPILQPVMETLGYILKVFENLMPAITALVGVISTVLGPVIETVKFVLQGLATMTGVVGPIVDTVKSVSQGFSNIGSIGKKENKPVSVGNTPVSTQTNVLTSNTTTNVGKSELSVTVGGAQSAKLTGNAPGVTLNTGTGKSRYESSERMAR